MERPFSLTNEINNYIKNEIWIHNLNYCVSAQLVHRELKLIGIQSINMNPYSIVKYLFIELVRLII